MSTKKENLNLPINELADAQIVQIEKNVSLQAVSTQNSFVTKVLDEMQKNFLEANPDLDMDFVYMTKWLSIDSKGNFIEKANEEIVKNFKDSMNVLIVKGEQKFSLWGHEGSPEEGELIVAEDSLEIAQQVLINWLERNPQAIERYNIDQIQSRYIAYIIPVENLKDEMPTIYTIGLAPTAKAAYGQWAYNVFSGAYKAKGIPKNTGVNQIVTNISTISKTNKQKQNYTSIQFDAVEMFKPDKYKIN